MGSIIGELGLEKISYLVYTCLLTSVATFDEDLDHIASSDRGNPVSDICAILVGFELHTLTAPADRGIGMQN